MTGLSDKADRMKLSDLPERIKLPRWIRREKCSDLILLPVFDIRLYAFYDFGRKLCRVSGRKLFTGPAGGFIIKAHLRNGIAGKRPFAAARRTGHLRQDLIRPAGWEIYDRT